MIVPSTELPDVKGIHQENIIVTHASAVDVSPDAPPPAYIPTAPASEPDGYATRIPEGVKPTNFLSLRRTNNSISGAYLIDPRLKIPASLLEPLAPDETEETRRNLFLHTNLRPGLRSRQSAVAAGSPSIASGSASPTDSAAPSEDKVDLDADDSGEFVPGRG
ncbi:hypothetical protein C8J57DRAFT_1727137 [Mycena rebaudengoi]|nr:hypothetical protein C8J57DRAFT_1727137 [Mycena rebaudengoi]